MCEMKKEKKKEVLIAICIQTIGFQRFFSMCIFLHRGQKASLIFAWSVQNYLPI